MRRPSERDREFTDFVTAQRAALVNTARLLVSGDTAKAEDVVQIALTRLYLSWSKVRPETVGAYARRCVVNAAIDEHRSVFRRREQVWAELPEVAIDPRADDPTVVAADVARGQQAQIRRRRQRFAVTGAFVAVAAAAAVGVGQFGQAPDTPSQAGTSVAQEPTPGGSGQARLQLVAYRGEQPTGFKVSTVPDGWLVVSSDPSAFIVEPASRGELPEDKPGPLSLDGRITVSLQGQSQFPPESPVKEVDVNGRAGKIGHPLDAPGKLSDTRWLFFPDASGRKVQVQVPAKVNLSDEQVVDFAKGVAVTSEAVEIGG